MNMIFAAKDYISVIIKIFRTSWAILPISLSLPPEKKTQMALKYCNAEFVKY